MSHYFSQAFSLQDSDQTKSLILLLYLERSYSIHTYQPGRSSKAFMRPCERYFQPKSTFPHKRNMASLQLLYSLPSSSSSDLYSWNRPCHIHTGSNYPRPLRTKHVTELLTDNRYFLELSPK